MGGGPTVPGGSRGRGSVCGSGGGGGGLPSSGPSPATPAIARGKCQLGGGGFSILVIMAEKCEHLVARQQGKGEAKGE